MQDYLTRERGNMPNRKNTKGSRASPNSNRGRQVEPNILLKNHDSKSIEVSHSKDIASVGELTESARGEMRASSNVNDKRTGNIAIGQVVI